MAPAAGRRLTVGAVVHQLSAEFPDVTISKMRFLESEGLVTPDRTASGYRQFTPDDVERIRYVLRAQRDRFWPLKVIKANLEAIDRGLTPADDGDAHPRRATAGRRPRRAGCRAARLPPCPAADRRRAGPGRRAGTGRGRRPGVARAAAPGCRRAATTTPTSRWRTPQRGCGAYGVEPRHLRSFRAAADREVGLVEQVVGAPAWRRRAAPRRRGGAPVPRPARGAGPRRPVGPEGLTGLQVRGVR